MIFAEIKFYLALFLRRLHYFLLVFLAVAGIGVTVAYTLPPEYRAEATLLVESPQIPGELAESTVRVETAEILQIIRQRLLTRANLLDIAREFNVFPNALEMSADDIVEGMRKRISMSLPRRRDAAAFFTLSFSAPNGRMSAEVTNDMVTRVLEENVSMRTSASSETLAFFEREVTRLNQELSDHGDLILKFKLENKDALPDSLSFRRNKQTSLQERLLQLDRELAGLNDRRERMQTLYDQTGRLAATSGGGLNPDISRLQELQDNLAYALTLYTDQNPRVKNIRKQIEALEQKIGQAAEDLESDNSGVSAFGLQMLDLESQIGFTTEQKEKAESELTFVTESIDATPANAVTLGSLERDYENVRIQYNQAVADLAKARTGDQIEAQSRGQRISVIEQAVVPNEPTDPNRRSIAMASIALAAAAGAGFVFLLEIFSSSLRRSVDVTNQVGIAPLVTIPYSRSRRQVLARRAAIFASLAIVAIGLPSAIYLLHIHYLPIDMMVERMMNSTGLSNLLQKLGVG